MKDGLLSVPSISGNVWTVWLRNADVFRKTWTVNLIPPFIEPFLYLLALGFGLGGFVGQIGGISYIVFIAPAIVAISIMNSGFFECTYGSYVRMYLREDLRCNYRNPGITRRGNCRGTPLGSDKKRDLYRLLCSLS